MVGCSGSLRSTWINFNSYYNTFYNAKLSYDRGYRQFENQVDRINPERPIRIHRAPVRTGRNDFEDAIERGTDLLIRFPESRHVDDAVALIGRSYYFLENFFNAEQKFIELFTISENQNKRQQAVIWRARIMLDLERHNEAINFITNQLESPELDWGRREQAEAQLLLAQHYVKMERWDEAGELLYEALPNTRDRELRGRGYFLHGQILEYLGAYEASYEAYDMVRRSNPYYQLIYFSELRRGIVLRKMGENDLAYEHFMRMSRNDNHFENLAAINYEIGRTLQAKGETDQAIRRYKDVLYRSFRTPQREVLAKTHYGLAEIYRFDLRNYNLAAAYYDSSARNASNEDLLPRGFDARTLSRSFNEFARLNEQAVKKDSLLWLGSLPAAQFDSVITVIQARYREQMERERRQQQRDTGRIVTVDPGQIEEAEEGDENGFLFHLNRTLVAQASTQFQARWGARPLVDNWRRIEAVRQAQILAEEDEEFAEEIVYVEEIDPIELELDLSEIPRTRQARNDMREQLARTKYELGNIFFLSLSMPDSARSVYENIVVEFPEASIIPQTMYSLSELHHIRGDVDYSLHWARMIADKHPETIFARRLNERFDLGISPEVVELAPKEAKIQEYHNLLASADTLTISERAHVFFAFAEADTLTDYAPDAYLSAAKDFIRLARDNGDFDTEVTIFNNAKRDFNLATQDLAALQDSANVVLADTSITEDLREKWEAVRDSSITEPDFRAMFPYHGEHWDSARASLEILKERFPRYERIQRVRTLYSQIELLPEIPEEPEEPEKTQEDYIDVFALEEDTSQVYECAEIDTNPVIIGGVEQFLQGSAVKELMQEFGVLEALFEYRVTIDAEGNPDRVFGLDTEDELGMQDIIREEILQSMLFEPLVHENKRVTAICEIQVPVVIE